MQKLSLFRPEAIAFQRDPMAAGDVLPVPPSAAVLTWLLALLVCTATALLGGGSFAHKESVPGFLTPTLGVAKVLPPRAGLVVAVSVREGEVVEAGAPLLTVQVGQTDASGSDVDDRILQSLSRQRAALSDQIGLEQAKSAAERQQLVDQINGLDQEVAALRSELETQRQRTRVAQDQVTAVRGLVKAGFISLVEFKHRQDNLLAQQQNEAALVRQIAERQSSTTQQRDALRQLPDTLAARLSVLRGSIADLEGRLSRGGGHIFCARRSRVRYRPCRRASASLRIPQCRFSQSYRRAAYYRPNCWCRRALLAS